MIKNDRYIFALVTIEEHTVFFKQHTLHKHLLENYVADQFLWTHQVQSNLVKLKLSYHKHGATITSRCTLTDVYFWTSVVSYFNNTTLYCVL